MKKIEIKIPQKEYNVFLGKNIFPRVLQIFKQENLNSSLLLVIDSNVKKYYFELILNVFNKYPFKNKPIIITASEKNKSFDTLQKIHLKLIKHNFGRDSVIVAIGGGIIGDIAGFAASTYMRGIKYVQIPTTLLASVDSSVGGKTGINFGSRKNIVGSFYQPELVLIDTNFFGTLTQDEMLCGLGEVIKYCFLTEQKFFDYVSKNIDNILNNKPSVISRIISESIIYKGNVVEADEKEAGIRKVLNLGHTFAHAFEVQQNHKLKHGQAVIIGITCALYLSYNLNLINQKDFSKFLKLLLKFELMIKLTRIDENEILKIMMLDKKNRQNRINFVLIKKVGHIVTDISASDKMIKNSLKQAISHFTK